VPILSIHFLFVFYLEDELYMYKTYNTMKPAIQIAIIISTITLVGMTAISVNYNLTPANAANPVSGAAQTNGNYQTGCKTGDTARECATGSGDNGDNTCGTALAFFGPGSDVQCGTQGVPPPPPGRTP
jgi:hypothetical protein